MGRTSLGERVVRIPVGAAQIVSSFALRVSVCRPNLRGTPDVADAGHVDGRGVSRSADDEWITPCADGSYCCGKDELDCCASGQGVFLVNGTTVPRLPSSTSSTLALSPTSTSIADDVSQLRKESDSSKKIGIGVGLGAGVSIALLGISLGFWLRKKGQRSEGEQYEKGKTTDQIPQKGISWNGIPVELDKHGRVAELLDERSAWGVELSGQGRAELGNERTVWNGEHR